MNTQEFIAAWHSVMVGKENNERQGKRNYSEYKWEQRKEKRTGITVDLLGTNRNHRAGVVVVGWFFFFFFFLSERKGGKGKRGKVRLALGVWTRFSRGAFV